MQSMIPPQKPLAYPINKVMIVYLLIIATYGAAGYFFGPWWVLGYMAVKELLGILYEAYKSQKYLDRLTEARDNFLNAVNDAVAKAEKEKASKGVDNVDIW
jgi:hypothetical protein